MDIVYKKVKDLIPYDKNTKKHDRTQIDNVAESIKQYGFVQPLVIDKNNEVVIGHCRLLASKKLKMDEVPCVCVDDLTEEQVKALRIVDNKTNESDWDIDFLVDELDDIDLSMFDFDFDLPNEDEEIYEDVEHKSLNERFGVPPFSILDTRQGYWQDRKKQWKSIINDNGQARKNAKANSNQGFKNSNYQQSFSNLNDTSILDPVLAEVMTLWFNKKDGKVFDVFAGDTIFGYVCTELGCKFTGIELRKEQAKFNNENTNEKAIYICDDGRNVQKHIELNSQDMLFSCPPYYDLEVYSNLENDASNQKTFEEFYNILDIAFTKAIGCLKENRFAVIVASDIRDGKGEYYDFISKIKHTFISNGMCLYNELILVDAIGTGAIVANRYMKSRKIRRTHQEVLVFYKGDIKQIKNEFEEIEVPNFESTDMEL